MTSRLPQMLVSSAGTKQPITLDPFKHAVTDGDPAVDSDLAYLQTAYLPNNTAQGVKTGLRFHYGRDTRRLDVVAAAQRFNCDR
jgi:hypothetical protein